MTKIKLIGREIEPPATASAQNSQDDTPQKVAVPHIENNFLPAEVLTTVAVGAARGATEEVDIEARDNDVLELELEDGLRLWTSVEQLREDLAVWQGRGEVPSGDAMILPTQLPILPPSRGPMRAFALRTLRLLRIDKEITEDVALKLAEKLENHLKPGPGLYKFVELFNYQREIHHGKTPDNELKPLTAGRVAKLKSKNGEEDPDQAPYLIFIHGTASNTFGSFDGLVLKNPELWNDLVKTYGERLLAFDHRTWSTSPIENAHSLLKLLPDGARLHLVTFSRGGLIGELLCRGQLREDGTPRVPFDAQDEALFDSQDDHNVPGRAEQKKALKKLDRLLRQRQPRIERYVRVACPARGTTLASKRLDRFFSILLNLIGITTGSNAHPLYLATKTLLLALAKQRASPDVLPGLEAMMPTSPLIRMLNRPGVTVEADLSVVAGDVEGSGFFGKLKIFATDAFFATQHDLVVDTPSMYGGQLREKGETRFFFDEGTDVNHFRYFNNFDTAKRVVQGVLWRDIEPEGFERFTQPDPSTPLRRNWLRDLLSRGALEGDLAERALRQQLLSRGALGGETQESALRQRPVVFLLPGIMGSHLSADGNRIWVDLSDIAKGSMKDLAHDRRVTADALVDSAYRDLAEFLSQSQDVIPFPYDWRSSLVESGRLLGEAVQARLDESDQPVRLVAHSMGGMVARAMMLECPEVWKAMCDRGGRLVMLGTPNQGSHVITRVLVGQEGMVKNLALVDLKHNRRELLEIVSRFRGLLELLPLPQGDEDDLFELKSWEDLHNLDKHANTWERPKEKDLEAARDLRKRFDEQTLDPQHVVYVAGKAPSTPMLIRPKKPKDENGKGKIEFLAVRQGDGRVPWSTGIPPRIRTWYLDAMHGKLAAHKPAFDALLDLVLNGETRRLPTQPPAFRGDRVPPFLLPDDEIHLYPDQREFEDSMIGYLGTGEQSTEPPIRVVVAQGNLAFARHPLVVGHYEKDAIVSAEAALDRRLDGLLSQRHRLGRYPGPLDTAEVLFAPKDIKPEGAIIVGLGKVGELTAGRLRSSIRNGLLEYAQRKAEQFRNAIEEPSKELRVSALLIGSGEGGVPLIESLRSLLQATLAANVQLAAEKIDLRIRHLEIVELYEDLAIAALRTLERLRNDPTLKLDGQTRFELADRLVQDLPGGRRRIHHQEDDGWWHRLQIQRKDDSLHFDSLSRRARSEKEDFEIDDCILKPLLDTATLNQRADREVCKTLFELLLPNSFKDHAPDERPLLLLLDKTSAVYPWELMIDPTQENVDENRDAQALRSGLIRQLALEENEYRLQPRYADSGRALVIGDTQAPEGWAELPGAQKEAKTVGKLLERHGIVTDVRIRPKGTDLVKILIPGNFRILHLAGHGVYDSEQPDTCDKVTGMVLGDGIYLQAKVIGRIRPVPELVFLNCCFLGKIEDPEAKKRHETSGSRAALAANLATEFISMGAKAVVAAGWMVDDDAAHAFADTFYTRMLAGETFGNSVLLARQEAAKFQHRTNTWGAYQCYGDPYFVLKQARGAQPSSNHTPTVEAPTFVSPWELKIRLENMIGEAETSTRSKVERLRKELKLCEATLPKAWLEFGGISTAFGKAYAELGLFGHAIRSYRQAITAAKASASLTDIEQLANLECRLAVMRITHQTMGGAEDQKIIADSAEVLMEKCDARLQRLMDKALSGETIERHILRAAASKRKAMIEKNNKKRLVLLKEMQDDYEKAHQWFLREKNEPFPYPLHSWLAGRALRNDSDRADVETWLNKARDLARRRDSHQPSFWNGIISAENLLTRYLFSDDTEHAPELSAHYLRAQSRGASPRQIQSVLEHLNFVATILEAKLDDRWDEPTCEKRKAKAGVIRQVYEEFRRKTGAQQL